MTEEFDYIVVGAGSAGCVVASRLSEDPGTSVLLIEAGGRVRNPLFRVPLLATVMFSGPIATWRYYSEPEPHLDNRPIYQPRGRALGGSSAINGMMYVRGHARDYDQWAQSGLTGWSYADVLPYFKRSERHEAGGGEFHGGDGPLAVSKCRIENPLREAIYGAAKGLGMPFTDDFNGAQQEGFGRWDFTTKNGKRFGVATAFLDPVRHRPNLTVRSRARATRLVVEGSRASGLEYLRGGKRETVRAKREVIVSLGAFDSPALLMRSGIGPADHLRAHGITVAHDLPGVGQNMQDHVAARVTYACTQPITYYSLRRPDRACLAVARTLMFGDGPGSQIPFMAGAFLRTRPELERPDIQMIFVPGLPVAKLAAAFRAGPEDRHGFSAFLCVLRPEARGSVSLRSADPLAPAVIRGNYYGAENDRRSMREAIRLTRRVFAEPAFDPYRGDEIAPGASATSDAELDAFVRRTGYTIFHPVGTCRMGNDPQSVVDGSLKVRGVAGLRVVDASVMPTIIGGNTNAPTIMIAEKAADMIRGRTPPPRAELASAA